MTIDIHAIGIGTRRSASSFLHDCLNQHPEIVKPRRGTHYFSVYSNEGASWYAQQFPKKNTNQIYVEYSISYTYPQHASQAAKNIYNTNPNAKIFLTIRDPVKRAYSDYLRARRFVEIPENLSFEQAIEQFPEFIERGHYQKLLSPYFDLFPSHKIKLIFFDDLNRHPEKTLNELCSFLEISSYTSIDTTMNSKEAGRDLKFPKIQTLLLYTKLILDRASATLRLEKQWNNIKNNLRSYYQLIRAANTIDSAINKNTSKQLYRLYEEDIEWVKSVTGRCFNEDS